MMVSNEKDETRKKEGEIIMQNYKKQLAERDARDRYDQGDL
jgi:hypothetical protein